MLEKFVKLSITLIMIIFFANATTTAEGFSEKRSFIKPFEIDTEKAIDRARKR